MTAINTNGMKPDSILDRHHMLLVHQDEITRHMEQCGLSDPVGLVIDLTDTYGNKIGVLAMMREKGVTQEEARTRIDRMKTDLMAKGQFATMLIGLDLRDAEELLPLTSPTAKQNLDQMRKRRQPGQCLVVAIGSGGNSYGLVQVRRASMPPATTP